MMIIALAAVSVLTTLTTEACKKMLDDAEMAYSSNCLAAIVAVVLSIAVSGGYMIYTCEAWTPQTIVTIVSLAFLSFLGATVGWDKVMQAIDQIKKCS